MLKKILIALAVLVAAFAAFVALQPADYRITRSATISASPRQVFRHVNDFHRINVEFVKPFEGASTSEFSFKPAGDRTAVTWDMYGKNNFVGRALCVFVNVESMLGGDMEKGLRQLKTVAEKPATTSELEKLPAAAEDYRRPARSDRARP